MGELLRRGFDAQLADRNTKGYDIAAGPEGKDLKRIQVKSVRLQPWFVRRESFEGELLDQVTVYVLLGPEASKKPVRFFIVKNREVAHLVHYPADWPSSGFLKLKSVERFEDAWDTFRA